MAPLSEREMRMLLALIEVEREKADAIAERWSAEPEEGYEDGHDALLTEQEFARGYALGVKAMETLLGQVLNA